VWGWFHCSHNHCADRTLQDVIRLFTPEELDQARAAACLLVKIGYAPPPPIRGIHVPLDTRHTRHMARRGRYV
jgi:hypothetical protein